VSDQEQPRPNWWIPSPEGEPPPPTGRPLPPAPTRPGPPPATPYPQPYPPAYPPPYGQPYIQPYGPGYAAPTTNGMAVASLVCGIVGLVGWLGCFFGAVASIPGLVLGIVGLQQVNRSNGMQKGRGLAIAGIVTSALAIVVTVAILILFGIGLSAGALV
jgi:Domain of unknown function (DUF4190)